MYRFDDHPERRKGEVWITNCDYDNFINGIYWKTKRIGNQAYDIDDLPINQNCVNPVFVSAKEIVENNLEGVGYAKSFRQKIMEIYKNECLGESN